MIDSLLVNSPMAYGGLLATDLIPLDQSMATVAYIVAAVLFVLSLAGLSNQTTARRGN